MLAFHPCSRAVRDRALLLSRRFFGMCAFGAVALTVPALGQSTAASAPSPEATGDIIELSPFSVEAGDDDGYVATSSLAGTRIKADLKDIANSITVVTQEFMRDVNATKATDLLVYTGNTEAGGVAGNYSGADVGSPTFHTGVIRQPQNNNRVRGLARADLTRDYFPTTMTFDSYNTVRVEINRGPNATLFGLGSPGGVINNQLIQPTLNNKLRVEFNFGSFGSNRSAIDVDAVIVPEKLGLRVAALYEKEKFQQDFTFEQDRRLFAAAVYKPFKNANLRGSFEKGRVDANRPRANSPRDTLTRWWDPAFNKITHSPAGDEFGKVDRDIVRAPGDWFFQPGIVFDSNDTDTPARMMYAWYDMGGVPRTPGGNPNTPFRAYIVSITKGDQWYPSTTAAAQGIKYGSFYTDEEIGDTSIFDWRNNLLDGPNKKEWEDFEVFNLSYDQSWKHGLGSVGFEAAYNNEDHTRSFYDISNGGRGNTINIDINTTLPWGAPNPNFGRPFIAANGVRNEFHAERENTRLTAFLELDFARNTEGLFRWLGRHNMTGYYNDYTVKETGLNGRNRAGLDWVNAVRAGTSTPNLRNSGDGELRTAVYIGPSLANLSSPKGIDLQGLQQVIDPAKTVTGYYWDRPSLSYKTIQTSGVNVLDDDNFYNIIDGANLTQQKISSYAFIEQAYLLPGEWVVGTLGWRHDKVEDFRNNAGNDVRDEFNFIDLNSPNFVLPSEPGSVFEENIFSYGVVVHAPPFIPMPEGTDISVHYSKAENFQPADARITIFGDPIQPPGGTTKDYGFSVSLFNNKLQARFNWYETTSDRASLGYPGFLAGETDARVIRYNAPADVAAAGWKGPPQFFKDLTNWTEFEQPNSISGIGVQYTRPGNMSDIQSTSSKGMEVDLTYNPLPNWRIALNVAQQKAERANIAPFSKRFFALRESEWLNPPTGLLISDESSQPVNVRVFDTFINEFNGTLAREGQAVSELREWRANLITNYAFGRDSKLRGWSLGGAVRWQDEVGIGYPIVTVNQGGSALDIPDLANPYLGPAKTNVDAWFGYTTKLNDKVRVRFQINVRNLFDDTDLIPVAAQPDGSISSWVAPVGRTYNFRTVFEF